MMQAAKALPITARRARSKSSTALTNPSGMAQTPAPKGAANRPARTSLARRIHALTAFVVAVALAYCLVPLVDWLHQRFKIPRILSILALYLTAFGLVAAGILAIEPTLSTESRELGQNAPQIVEQFFRDAFGGDQI